MEPGALKLPLLKSNNVDLMSRVTHTAVRGERKPYCGIPGTSANAIHPLLTPSIYQSPLTKAL